MSDGVHGMAGKPEQHAQPGATEEKHAIHGEHLPLQEPDTSVYDAFLEQLAEDTKQYVIAVFKTLTATVPKAIIHAQVCISAHSCLVMEVPRTIAGASRQLPLS